MVCAVTYVIIGVAVVVLGAAAVAAYCYLKGGWR
jgi:hypothetical protein